MTPAPVFPTSLHQHAAEAIRDYFLNIPQVDTVLIVNSCARGHAVPESDLDVAILATAGAGAEEIGRMEADWLRFAARHETILEFKQSMVYRHVHLDVISGLYEPAPIEIAEPLSYFEVEIGNQVCYSAPMGGEGNHFKAIKQQWLPYYNESLRLERLEMAKQACEYELNHIPLYVKRGLHFHAFDILWKAFQSYLLTLFIAEKTYPIAYNKWIKEQVVNILNKPDLYAKLPPVLSVRNLESNEINDNVQMLLELLRSIKTAN